MKQQLFESAQRMLTVASLEDVQFQPDTVFVYSEASDQDRANREHWAGRLSKGQTYFAAEGASYETLSLRTETGKRLEVNVKDVLDLKELFPRGSNVVIDISGIDHDFWAGCLLALQDHVETLTYIYTEPSGYQGRAIPDRADPFDLFDLSPRTRGLGALSGFANLGGPFQRQSLFVPLLGFEGQRALNVYHAIDPGPTVTVPVMGIPGYQIQFPTFSSYCNKAFFEETQSHSHWRMAPANDPFALCALLVQIGEEYPDHYMYVAPIGTRPHALGSLLFVQQKPESSEILFDHPVSQKGSRRGRGLSHLYCILP